MARTGAATPSSRDRAAYATRLARLLWRVDFHALRDTFGTHLAVSGAALFVLKELMRHSTLQQSGKYYIDARHLPLAAAVASLPAFSLPLAAKDESNGVAAAS